MSSLNSLFNKLFGVGKTAPPPKTTAKTKAKAKSNASKSDSKCSTKAKRSSSKASVASRSSQESQQSNGTQRSTNSRSNSTLANVFAPRLLHIASIPTDGATNCPDAQWLGVKTMAENGFHCAVYLIHCAQHNKVAVTKPSEEQALWMPFTPIPSNRSWEESGLAGLLLILAEADMDRFLRLKSKLPFTERHLIEVFEIQLPHTLEIISRLAWYVRLDQRVVKSDIFKCCQDTNWLKWIDAKDISEQNTEVIQYQWGPELMDMACSVATAYQNGQTPCSNLAEYSLEMAFKYLPRNPPVDDQQQLLYSANLSEKDVERLYGDFLDHCFPSTAMSEHSFKVYMTKYGLQYSEERLDAYFRAKQGRHPKPTGIAQLNQRGPSVIREAHLLKFI